MTFLVLLLALALEKFSGWRRRIQRDGAWLAWLSLVEDLPSVSRRSWLGLLLAVVLPLLPLALLLTLLQSLAYGWLSLPLHLLVVVYSLGRGDVMADLGPFRDAWRREEAQAAFHVAERDLGILGGSESELIGRVHGHLLWQGYQSFFAVIFWYALLGPVAALAYRPGSAPAAAGSPRRCRPGGRGRRRPRRSARSPGCRSPARSRRSPCSIASSGSSRSRCRAG